MRSSSSRTPRARGCTAGIRGSYTALDIVARKRRMQGYNVLFPMGWDAFGLPTENYAIANKIHPAVVTENNVRRFREQLKALGLSFDWQREINTTDPSYYTLDAVDFPAVCSRRGWRIKRK